MLVVLLSAACGKNGGAFDATGTFEATEVIVSAEVAGKLMCFDVMEGEIVQANEVVGYVDTVQLYLKKLQLEANLTAVGSRRADIQKQIAATKQQIATARHEQQRFVGLLKANAANQKQVDDLDAQVAVLEKQLAAQISTLENNNRGVTGESSAVEVQVAQLDDQLLKCRIVSPLTGTVLVKYAEPGEYTSPGKGLFKVADLQHIYLRAYITADQLSRMKLGQEVSVYSDFGQKDYKEYPGRVTWISAKAEFTPKTIQTRDERANQVYAVKITVVNDGLLKIGMYGGIKIAK